jgi:hypothetical protein
MQTVAAAIGERVEELRELLREFLLEHSGSLRDINKPSSSLVFVGPHSVDAPVGVIPKGRVGRRRG